MNTKFIFTALVLSAAAGSALAQEATVVPSAMSATSTLSRATVHAEAVKAVQAGLIGSGEATILRVPQSSMGSDITRAQAVAEAVEAKRLGLLPTGEATKPAATATQLRLIREAGLRALQPRAS